MLCEAPKPGYCCYLMHNLVLSQMADLLLMWSQVVVRLNLGIDTSKNVAMKLTVRASTPEMSEVIHQIVQSA